MTDPSQNSDAAGKSQDTPDTFDAVLEALEGEVERLERGDLPLEESLRAFERGVALAQKARAMLDAAEARVEELLGVTEDGEAITRPVELSTEA